MPERGCLMALRMVKGPGRSPVHNWLELRNEWEASGVKYLRDWCKQKIVNGKEINYQYASKQFAEIARLEEQENLSIARNKLARFAPKAVDTIGQLTDSEDENVKLKASTAIVDRVGLNPQSATINIQNTNATQVIIPAMFADSSRDDLKRMLDGEGEDE